MRSDSSRRSSARSAADPHAPGGAASTTTIVAISSPPGPAVRGVLRLSGPATPDLVAAVFTGVPSAGERAFGVPPRRGVFAGRLRDARGSLPARLLWMPAPHSYTREDVAEFHLPGAASLLDAALERLLALGAVPAAPGEFTRRAFLNGRLDLTEAEGVLELIEASGEGERRAAGLLLGGGLARRVAALREVVEDLRGLCEASLDFDEADTGHVPVPELAARAADAAALLDEALGWEVRRQAPRALPRVVLHGAPNSGKSSLFNALLRPALGALVSTHAGTTRDFLTGVWELPGGAACLLLDVPGLDPGAGEGVDGAAQVLAARERGHAALVLHVTGSEAAVRDATGTADGGERAPAPEIRVHSKVDLHPGDSSALGPGVATSAVTGAGLVELGRAVEEALGLAPRAGGAEGGLARELFARHRHSLLAARGGLEEARCMLEDRASLDLVAEVLRGASTALDGISGHTAAEDVLDRIFSRFCIGK